ncbi:MAG: hypothetical protein ACYT04_49700 [Nostoc sp.]
MASEKESVNPTYLCLGLPRPIGTELFLKDLQKQMLPPQNQALGGRIPL